MGIWYLANIQKTPHSHAKKWLNKTFSTQLEHRAWSCKKTPSSSHSRQPPSSRNTRTRTSTFCSWPRRTSSPRPASSPSSSNSSTKAKNSSPQAEIGNLVIGYKKTYVTLRDTRDMKVWTKISYWIFNKNTTKYIYLE